MHSSTTRSLHAWLRLYLHVDYSGRVVAESRSSYVDVVVDARCCSCHCQRGETVGCTSPGCQLRWLRGKGLLVGFQTHRHPNRRHGF